MEGSYLILKFPDIEKSDIGWKDGDEDFSHGWTSRQRQWMQVSKSIRYIQFCKITKKSRNVHTSAEEYIGYFNGNEEVKKRI